MRFLHKLDENQRIRKVPDTGKLLANRAPCNTNASGGRTTLRAGVHWLALYRVPLLDVNQVPLFGNKNDMFDGPKGYRLFSQLPFNLLVGEVFDAL